MENESKPQNDVMECDFTDKTEEDLKAEGWIEKFSFHKNIPEQWNEACEIVRGINRIEGYKAVLSFPDNDSQKKDGIQLIFMKRPEDN